METPGATAKIPNVSASVGPIDEEGHNVGDADFVEAPTATTFLASVSYTHLTLPTKA